MATKGMPRQIFAATTEKRAFQLSPRKLMLVWIRPAFTSTHEMIENWLSYIHQNAIAESVVGTIQGKRRIARMKDLRAIFWLSSKASNNPRTNLNTLATAV